MEPVRDEHRGLYSNLFPVKKQDGVQICHQLKGPELVYKETNFHDGNVERRSSEHQERRLGGYNVMDTFLMKGAIEPVRDEHRRLLRQFVPVQETGRGFRSVINLRGLNKETNFQDDNVEGRFSEHQERRLGGYNRPQGRIPTCAYREGHRRFIGFWWQGRRFQFRRHPIQFCSSNLHDDQPASCGYVQGEGDPIDSLFRRFPGVGSELAVDFSHQYNLRYLNQAGFRQNLKKCHLQPRQKLEYLCLQWDSGRQDHKIFVD